MVLFDCLSVDMIILATKYEELIKGISGRFNHITPTLGKQMEFSSRKQIKIMVSMVPQPVR